MPDMTAREAALEIRRNLRRHKARMAERDKHDDAYWNEAQKARQRAARNGAKLMALEHIQGLSVAQLAQKYRVSPRTVGDKLRYARRMRLVEHQVNAMVKELVPTALGVYELAMSDIYHEVNPQVVTVATKVLEGTGVLRKLGEGGPSGLPASSDGDINTIEEYRAWRVTRSGPASLEAADANGGYGTGGRGAVLDQHQADQGGDLDGQFTELPEGGDGGGQDPAGGDPQDQGCGG